MSKKLTQPHAIIDTTPYYDRLSRGEVFSEQNPANLRRFHNQIKRSIIHSGLRQAQQKAKVLDLGCGRLGDVWKYRDHPQVWHYVGVDNSEVSIDEGMRRWNQRSRHPYRRKEMKTTICCTDMRDLDWEREGGYQLISAMFCLGYVLGSEETCSQFMACVRETLAPGGRFVLTVVDEESAISKMGLQNKVGSLLPMEADWESGKWGQRVQFSLFADNAGVVEQSEFLIPWSELVSVCAAEQLWLVESRLFHDTEGFANLTKAEQEISGLYRWSVFEKQE